MRDDWRKPFLWFIVISQWGHAPGDTRRPGGWLMICLDNTNNYTECWGHFAIWQMRMCWYSKCAMNVFSPSLCSSQLGTFASSKPKYLSGDKVFVYCPRIPLSVSLRELSLSSDAIPHNLHFFSPPSPVSWRYWQLKCSRSASVTLGDKKAGLHPLYALIFQSTGTVPAVLSDNWKENIHLIWQQQKTGAGRLNRFETDPNKSWWRNVAVLDWFTGLLFSCSGELNILQYSTI